MAMLKIRGADGVIYDVPQLRGKGATHSWNGTVLTVTSSSGTSSADLKGPVPQRGVDYWTNEDKAEIIADVMAAIPLANGVGF